MSTKVKTLIALIFITATITSLEAQDISTQGKEFWLSYMHNGFKEHDASIGHWVKTQVLISAKRDCSGTISNPNTNWQQDFTVQANSITSINVPDLQCYHDGNNYEQIDNKGIRIVADDTISVFSTNIAHVSFDASFVLPTESLGDDYIIQTYDQSHGTSFNDYVNKNLTSAFLIVATEDNTEIDLTPTVETFGHQPAGETFTITLNAGQTYHVRSNRDSNNRDLSGTRITAHDCKKIAVFNGNTLTCIPTSMSNGFDHVYEQAMPVHSWGKSFVVTSSADREYDYVKITSAFDDNVITKNGTRITTLQAGQSHTFKLTSDDGSCFIAATQTCAVYLYHESFNEQAGSRFGDPSMVWIAPIEQRIDEVTFSTFDHELIEIEKHYINIIVKTEDIHSVYFDGQLLPASSFQTVNGNNEYSLASKQINHGAHHLRCDNGFNAHVYGFGDAKGYAYMVGSKALNLSTTLFVNEEEIEPYGTYQTCSSKAIEFLAKVNYQDYDLLWDFGDGQTSTENPASHTYDNAQDYTAHLIISTDQAGCVTAESDTLHFYVSVGHEFNVVKDTTACEPFYLGGVLYDASGHYEIHETTAQGCDSILDLTLTMNYTSILSDIIPTDTCTSHWVIPATEYQVNSYKFSIYENEPRCHWENVQWNLSDNCDWVLVPSDDQKSCEVFVLGSTPDTVWLYADVTHPCCDSLGHSRKYWLLCSFYSIEEQDITTPDFTIVPNPNNGQMALNFENFSGDVNVKVYNMCGYLIDNFQIFNNGTSVRFGSAQQPPINAYNYVMERHTPGIYFFVASAKEGTVTKKVVVTK